MNGAMIKVLLFLATMLVSFSCGINTPIPESLLNVKSVVERLDSAVTVMYGWEPRVLRITGRWIRLSQV